MALGGDGWCPGCLTYSSSATSMLCSNCLLRESNEKIAKEQIDAINNSRPQSYNNQTGSVDSIFGNILGVILVFSMLTWFFSNLGFWESVVAVITVPLVIFGTVFTNLIN